MLDRKQSGMDDGGNVNGCWLMGERDGLVLGVIGLIAVLEGRGRGRRLEEECVCVCVGVGV
jgi:hypothetical protein